MTGRVLYLDCFAGLAGDMLLGALVDAGWPVDQLEALPQRLGLGHAVRVDVERVQRGPLAATRVIVEASREQPAHRRLGDITDLLHRSDLSRQTVLRATQAFVGLAEAEGKVHGVDPAAVEFHEVGALDAVIDIAGAAEALTALEVTEVWCSALPVGPGWAEGAHGQLPLPAPAVLELLAAVGAPIVPPPGPAAGELVTPTGAAIAAAWARFGQPSMVLRGVGHGAGTRQAPWPNVVRVWLGDPIADGVGGGEVVVIDTNIDDMNPELYEHVMDRLFAAGAHDVFLTPVQMKKSRPGTLVTVIAEPALEGAVTQALLSETTSLGVRVNRVHRHISDRTMASVDTPFGPVGVKVRLSNGVVTGAAPEYEDCRRLAREQHVPLADVYAAAGAAAEAYRGRGDRDGTASEGSGFGRPRDATHGS